MSALDRLARAEVATDLSHHDHDCPVDVLGAAGMSAAHRPEWMALFRLKYLRDTAEIDMAKRLFVRLARLSMVRRKLDATKASRVGVQALTVWINDVCICCRGVGYERIPGTPTLSDRECRHCNGTGRTQPRGEFAEVLRDLHSCADDVVGRIRARLSEKLA